jgi:hypothetical protein
VLQFPFLLDLALFIIGGSTILKSEEALACSQSSCLAFLVLDLALRVVEGGLVRGKEVSCEKCFGFDIQLVEGDRLSAMGGRS